MPFELERAGPEPIYRQLENWLREQIASGTWPVNHQLPAEIDLAAQLDINRGTVRKAIESLIDAGLLVRIHGRGTFVAARTLAQPLAERLTTFAEDLIGRHLPFVTRVLQQSVHPADDTATQRLALAQHDPIFFLKRVRDVEGRPFVLLENSVVHARCPGIEALDFTSRRLFDVLEVDFHLKIEWGQRDFEAHGATPSIAMLLDIEPGAPVMYMEQVAYLSDGTPLEYSRLWLRGDRFRLSTIVRRTGAMEMFADIDGPPAGSG